MAELANLWYVNNDSNWDRISRYNRSRYHALNLHSLFQRYHTLELRYGQYSEENSLEGTPIRAMVQLSLAINDLALRAKTASPKKPQDENPAYSFRTWLVRLGFIGEEFAESRKFLMRNFSGNSAWR